jgi:glycosyltransferase involved in cell wall biosynthesis
MTGIPMTERPWNVCLLNSADPRGGKVGGISTYVRDYIFYHPEEMNLLYVGPDEVGDLELGKINRTTFRGRSFNFLPLFRTGEHDHVPAKTLFHSETFQFTEVLLKNWGKLRRVLRDGNYSAEIQRVEFAPILKTMGVPFIQMAHVWGSTDKPMNSLLGRHPGIRVATEYLAAAFAEKFCSVNSDMTAMYKRKFPRFAHKFETFSTWANTTIFSPSPFAFPDDVIHVAYIGRMDKFKRPDIMFAVIAELARLTGGKVEFHYIGGGDPNLFDGFAGAAPFTVQHGGKTSVEIGQIWRNLHIGLLTSEFEGMPFFVLEALSSGRPVVSLHLPQLESVIADGESGYLIPRGDGQVAQAAARVVETYRLMREGAMTPEGVATHVKAFQPQAQLGKIYGRHKSLYQTGKV